MLRYPRSVRVASARKSRSYSQSSFGWDRPILKTKLNLVPEKFHLPPAFVQNLKAKPTTFGFDGFGEAVFYRTYSRLKVDGSSEDWADVVTRVTEGIFSIRKSHLLRNGLRWREDEMQKYALGFADSMFKMYFLPPGRGLYTCGTSIIEDRGTAAANNCGVASMKDLAEGAQWTTDALMCGIGVGTDTQWDGRIHTHFAQPSKKYVVDDSREGWAHSVYRLVRHYTHDEKLPDFDYSQIRPRGVPLKNFGGTAAGPENLIKLHRRISAYLGAYQQHLRSEELGQRDDTLAFKELMRALQFIDYQELGGSQFDRLQAEVLKQASENPSIKKYDKTRCLADIVNAIGACVVAGNIRRSSEILLGDPDDQVFLNLKNYKLNPERQTIGWMSNNTVRLSQTPQFSLLPNIAERILDNGEPGIFNQLNVQRYGRVGRHFSSSDVWSREHEPDLATKSNPCSEIPLEDFELCCLAEAFPSRCLSGQNQSAAQKIYEQALEYATFYASTIALLPTHWESTNAVSARNRRIGVSLSGITDAITELGFTTMTKWARLGYRKVREVNTYLAREAGVPASIRVTTVKPSGSISQLAGVSPGIHFPTFRHSIRRMRIADDSPLVPVFQEAGYVWEKDVYSDRTLVFEFPIDQGKTRTATEVSMWEQFSILQTFQREWSDNMVSMTVYFDPKREASQLEYALAQHAPLIKSVSMLPHTEHGAYRQMPYESITREQYLEKKSKLKPMFGKTIKATGVDGEMPLYCSNDGCEMPSKKEKKSEVGYL